MLPELRAAADKLVLDCANLEYLVGLLRDEDLERQLPTVGWSVHGLIDHVITASCAHSYLLPLLANPIPDEALDEGAIYAKIRRQSATMSVGQLLDLMSEGRDRLIQGLGALSEEQLDMRHESGLQLREIIAIWVRHIEEHTLDFVDGIARLRFDPMLLNWILYADHSDDAARFSRQQQLAEDAREYLRDHRGA